MPTSFEIRKKLSTRSERVKSVCLHATEPWVLSALYNGTVVVHDYTNQSVVKSIEVSSLPLRCAKFVARKQWIITGGDDMTVRVYLYNTLEKLKVIDAHTDYIRYIEVHSTLPYILSSSDDMTIRLWNWDRDWQRVMTFEAHSHYVMMCRWSPSDPHLFASASLDRTIKVWNVPHPEGAKTSSTTKGDFGYNGGSNLVMHQPNFTLLGHERGVNALDYSPCADKPFIISGSDDKSVRVWDYQTKQCIQVLTGHAKNVSSVSYHPILPIILSAGEDGVLKIWHSTTYRLDSTLSHNMDRAWSLNVTKGSNALAIAYDEGTVVLKLGSDRPVTSMHEAKLICVHGMDVQLSNLRLVDAGSCVDGEKVLLSTKEMGTVEVFPRTISHHPNGRFIAVCGDGEYVLYTAQALRNKAFGSAQQFVWAEDGAYATLNSGGVKISIFRNFKETFNFKPPFEIVKIFGGQLLAVVSHQFVCFYDWAEIRLVRRIDVAPRDICWSDNGSFVALICTDAFYILKHDKHAVAAAIAGCSADTDDGIEIAFDLQHEVKEKITSGIWISDCFIFVTSTLRLQAASAGRIETIAYLEKTLYILGYIEEQGRAYFIDREQNVVTYGLCLNYLKLQAAVVQKNFDLANELLQHIPEHLHNRVARFMEHQGLKKEALKITRDLDHKFDLNLSLGNLDECAALITKNHTDLTATAGHTPASKALNRARWRQVGDSALHKGRYDITKKCFLKAQDYNSLFLLYTAAGDINGLTNLADTCSEIGRLHLSILIKFILRDINGCLNILTKAKRYSEAMIFARAYCPSKISDVLILAKNNPSSGCEEIITALADPEINPDLFTEFNTCKKVEELFQKSTVASKLPKPHQFLQFQRALCTDFAFKVFENASTYEELYLDSNENVHLNGDLLPHTTHSGEDTIQLHEETEERRTSPKSGLSSETESEVSETGLNYKDDSSRDVNDSEDRENNTNDYLI